MANKLNPKKRNRLLHLHVVLAYLMLENIDELEDEKYDFNENTKKFRASLEISKKECEKLLEDTFSVEGVKNSTYLQNIANKVGTIIRKEYKPIY